MCQMAHGAPHEGEVARHKCGNGHLSCVNPTHLCWGTVEQNKMDHHLHTARPSFMPSLSDEVVAYVKASTKLTNVLAVELGIHSAILRTLR
jgi:hypothetical protein